MVLARGREEVDVLKIHKVILIEIAPKIMDVIQTIIRRIAIALKPPFIWRGGGILIETVRTVKHGFGLKPGASDRR
jgi:hypothetical protein